MMNRQQRQRLDEHIQGVHDPHLTGEVSVCRDDGATDEEFQALVEAVVCGIWGSREECDPR